MPIDRSPVKNKLIDFGAARDVYLRGENVTEHLRRAAGVEHNTPAIIEMAYDLQAGTYIADTHRHRDFSEAYTAEISDVLKPHLRDGDSLLDIGCGELTNLSLLANKLPMEIARLYAFDISWSRIKVGLGFASEILKPQLYQKLRPFTADIGEIPLRSKSIDVAITSHALEPNGGRETELLREIFRVTRRVAVLFEPSYELNSDEGRGRMDRLGYVKNLERAASESGARVVDIIPMQNKINPLNPTAAYIIAPKDVVSIGGISGEIFSDPGSDNALEKHENFYFSRASALSYPIIEGIPILRSLSAVLTSALATQV